MGVEQDLPGSLAERYRVREVLGAGGFGQVFLAEDRILARPVALKLLHGRDLPAEETRRFLREARVTSRLRHPGVVEVYDHGVTPEGQAYIVYQFVSGRDLRRVPTAEVDFRLWRRLGIEVARTLHAAHLQGVVHRDVKPANILLSDSGQILLCDFGIARSEGTVASLTQEGLILGSLPYLAPELWRGEKATPASDQFALGATLYELRFGRPIHPSLEVQAILEAVQRGFRAVFPGGPGGSSAVDQVLAKALESAPEARHRDLATFAEALAACSGSSQPAETVQLGRPTSPGEPTRERPLSERTAGSSPYRRLLLAGGVVGLLLAGLLGFLGGRWAPSPPPPSPVRPPLPSQLLTASTRLEQAWEALEPRVNGHPTGIDRLLRITWYWREVGNQDRGHLKGKGWDGKGNWATWESDQVCRKEDLPAWEALLGELVRWVDALAEAPGDPEDWLRDPGLRSCLEERILPPVVHFLEDSWLTHIKEENQDYGIQGEIGGSLQFAQKLNALAQLMEHPYGDLERFREGLLRSRTWASGEAPNLVVALQGLVVALTHHSRVDRGPILTEVHGRWKVERDPWTWVWLARSESALLASGGHRASLSQELRSRILSEWPAQIAQGRALGVAPPFLVGLSQRQFLESLRTLQRVGSGGEVEGAVPSWIEEADRQAEQDPDRALEFYGLAQRILGSEPTGYPPSSWGELQRALEDREKRLQAARRLNESGSELQP